MNTPGPAFTEPPPRLRDSCGPHPHRQPGLLAAHRTFRLPTLPTRNLHPENSHPVLCGLRGPAQSTMRFSDLLQFFRLEAASLVPAPSGQVPGEGEGCMIVNRQLSSIGFSMIRTWPLLQRKVTGQPSRPALTMATARPITVMIPKDRSIVPTPAAPLPTPGTLVSLKLVASGPRVVGSEAGPSVAGSRFGSEVGGRVLSQSLADRSLEFMLMPRLPVATPF